MMNDVKLIASQILEDFSDIKNTNRVSDEDFEKGLSFAMLISEGRNKGEAYALAFGVETGREATIQANKFIRLKWVSQLVDRLITGNHILFADKHYKALSELYRIGMEGDSERNRVDALKAFIDCTKRPEAKVDTHVNIHIGSQMLQELEAQLAQLADRDMMVTKSGQIIDVEEIH